MSTDPRRLAHYRLVARARAQCIATGRKACARTDPVMRNLTRFLAKISEHTQGVQVGTARRDGAVNWCHN
jgi:hypothetical protein